jgi:hypothetical protein
MESRAAVFREVGAPVSIERGDRRMATALAGAQ